jgi:Leucine-rich repeat (LRR) protein
MMGRIMEAMQNIRTRVDVVDVLILENNNIPHLPSRAFGSVKVNRLFIENNRIQTIDRNAFAGVENFLTEIYIKEPTLNQLPHDAINYLRSLTVFSIDSSQIEEMPRVSGLQKLKLLKIDRSNITSIPPNTLKDLPGMRYLHVTNSKLQRLEVGVLEHLPFLVLANFTGNKISWIHPRAFRYMEQMQELVLADNEIRDAAMVGQAAKVIKTIQKLDLSNNRIEKLRDGSFLDIISLQEMSLADNRLTLMQRSAFHRLPRLKKINLSNNQIRNFHSEAFSDTPMVEELLLRNNRITRVSSESPYIITPLIVSL